MIANGAGRAGDIGAGGSDRFRHFSTLGQKARIGRQAERDLEIALGIHRLQAGVAEIVAAGDCVVQVCSHSFTPELNGHVRTADVGMLYDPGRPGEVAFATAWIDALKGADPTLRLRRNYPYIGKSDGVAQVLRRAHPADAYVGIELEVNQRYVEAGGPAWPKIRRTLVETLAVALQVRGGTGPDG